jgi:hypothetical protein
VKNILGELCVTVPVQSLSERPLQDKTDNLYLALTI